METRQHRKSRLGRFVVPVLAGSCLFYFVGEVQTGRYGLDAKLELAAQIEARKAQLKEVSWEREKLEQRVSLLQDGKLERDIIDENVRRVLNLAADDEIVILR